MNSGGKERAEEQISSEEQISMKGLNVIRVSKVVCSSVLYQSRYKA